MKNNQTSSKSRKIASAVFYLVCFSIFFYLMIANLAGFKTVEFIPKSVLTWAPTIGFALLTIMYSTKKHSTN